MTEPNDNRIHAEPIKVTAPTQPHGALTAEPPAESQSARDKFIQVLYSRRMMQPVEEWVIDVNLANFARELADKLRTQGYTEAASLVAAEATLLTNRAEQA